MLKFVQLFLGKEFYWRVGEIKEKFEVYWILLYREIIKFFWSILV